MPIARETISWEFARYSERNHCMKEEMLVRKASSGCSHQSRALYRLASDRQVVSCSSLDVAPLIVKTTMSGSWIGSNRCGRSIIQGDKLETVKKCKLVRVLLSRARWRNPQHLVVPPAGMQCQYIGPLQDHQVMGGGTEGKIEVTNNSVCQKYIKIKSDQLCIVACTYFSSLLSFQLFVTRTEVLWLALIDEKNDVF